MELNPMLDRIDRFKFWSQAIKKGKAKEILERIFNEEGRDNINKINIKDSSVVFAAVVNGDKDIIKYLVEKVANVNAQDSNGISPLHVAAESGNEEIVKILLDSGAKIDIRTAIGLTPLHYAAVTDHADIVSSLIRKGAAIDVKDTGGVTPLLLALECEQKVIVELLVTLGADINCSDETGRTVLHLAVRRANFELLQLFLRKKCNPNGKTHRGYTALHYATKLGNVDAVRLLSETGADLNAKTNDLKTSLLLAAEAFDPDPELVKILIERGAEINCLDSNNETPLFHAAGRGSFSVVELLVKNGAGIEIRSHQGVTPLILAARQGYECIVSLLVDAGADITCCDTEKKIKTVLWDVISNGLLKVMPLLEKRGVDFNVRMPSGEIPLLLAAKKSKKRIVQYLIKFGVDLNCSDEDDWTVLHYASRNKWPDVALDILERGGDVNAMTSDGKTPLHCACLFPRCRTLESEIKLISASDEIVELLELLCKKSADINARNVMGQTPSHLAFHSLYLIGESSLKLKVFTCLFKAGADCNLAEDGNESLFHRFITFKHLNLIRLGIKNGGYFEEGFNISMDGIDHLLLIFDILRDVSLCTRALVNKYNEKDLLAVYELVGDRLLLVENMKITYKSGVIQVIEESVRRDIEARGFCNVPQVTPMALSMLTVKSILSYFRSNLN